MVNKKKCTKAACASSTKSYGDITNVTKVQTGVGVTIRTGGKESVVYITDPPKSIQSSSKQNPTLENTK